MAVVLPMAGVQRHFCTMSMAFVSDDGKCLFDVEDCCCEEGKDQAPQSDCLIAAKPFPNADKSPAPYIPDADGAWILLPAAVADFPPAVGADVPLALRLRGPPVIPDPLYLTQRRLLL